MMTSIIAYTLLMILVICNISLWLILNYKPFDIIITTLLNTISIMVFLLFATISDLRKSNAELKDYLADVTKSISIITNIINK